MMGTGTFAEPTFAALLAGPDPVVGLVTQPDRAIGDRRGSTRQVGRGMKEIAIEHGIPVYQPERINTPEGVATLAGWQPDLLVVAAYGQILSKDVLATARLGGINVHASLLPKYRGAAPVAWAIYHGETESGVTIIRMSIALDAGDMLARESTPIGDDETAGQLETRLSTIGARLARETIERLKLGPVVGDKQDPALVTKAPKLTKELGRIDWSRPAAAVCRHIRAMQPWPTAYTYWTRPGKPPLRLLVVRARPAEGTHTEPPGTLLPAKHAMLVAAGDGTIVEISELQPEGKAVMTAGEFLRGRPVQPGDALGAGA